MGIDLNHDAGTKALMSDHGRMHAPGPDVASSLATNPAGPTGTYFLPRVTSVRARRSAISDKQQETWDRLWPELGRQARDADGPAELLDTGAWFGRRAPVVLEIGCGTGTSTLTMAQAEPDIDVVAVEVYRRGLAQLLGAIDRTSRPDSAHLQSEVGSGSTPVTNIRLIRGDGVEVLTHMFGPNSLAGVRVFFPDPWPKARHHKRRLLQSDTVALIADRLRPGGVLHAATDHTDYAAHIAEVGDAEPRLRRVRVDLEDLQADTKPLPISVVRPVTKYEGKAQRAGSSVAELLWEKTP
jgi:tRNA (guanine-N7-)-methyltransferase